MGFRNGAYASVFSVVKGSGNFYDVRLCTSRKNRSTGNYEQDFGGFVRFVGNAAEKISKYEGADSKNLGGNPIVRVKLGDVDTTNTYNKEKKITYTNHVVFTFDYPNGDDSQSPTVRNADNKTVNDYVANIPDNSNDDEELFT